MNRTRLLLAPDNAEAELVEQIGEANRSLRIAQVSIGSRRQPFLNATLAAARRGVDVRILLSSAWYVREDNRQLVRWLDERAASTDLPLEARLVRPRGRFEKLHAKGVVIDDRTVYVGSLNWNNHSARENREVVLELRGEAIAGYYAAVFDADWRYSAPYGVLPTGILATGALALGLAALVARRIEFEKETPVASGR